MWRVTKKNFFLSFLSIQKIIINYIMASSKQSKPNVQRNLPLRVYLAEQSDTVEISASTTTDKILNETTGIASALMKKALISDKMDLVHTTLPNIKDSPNLTLDQLTELNGGQAPVIVFQPVKDLKKQELAYPSVLKIQELQIENFELEQKVKEEKAKNMPKKIKEVKAKNKPRKKKKDNAFLSQQIEELKATMKEMQIKAKKVDEEMKVAKEERKVANEEMKVANEEMKAMKDSIKVLEAKMEILL